MKLDFSQFHPLDHTIWECRGYPGGRRRHASIVWTFKWEMPERLWQLPLHAFGRHIWRDYWANRDDWKDGEGEPTGQMCIECGETKTP